jgi:hypothetical protein
VVLYSAARLVPWFPQPKRIAREKGNRTPFLLRLHPLRSTMADKVTVVPPRDPWPFSTVTVDDLEALVADGLLRPLSGDPQPEWMAPASEADLTPPLGYVVSFVSFHERGFGVPASRFMRALLHYYGVELHNFNPNSIAQAAIFAVVCESFLGINPHWDLWTHLFSVELFALTTGEKKVRMAVRAGGCTLQLRQGRAQQYIPAILVSSNKGWQRRWFLPPERQRKAPVVFSTSGDRRQQQLALRGHTRETRESLASSGGLAEVTRWGAHCCGGGHRHPSPEGAPFGRAADAALGDEAGVDLEGSQMSSAPLSADDLRRRIAGTVGRLDAGALT